MFLSELIRSNTMNVNLHVRASWILYLLDERYISEVKMKRGFNFIKSSNNDTKNPRITVTPRACVPRVNKQKQKPQTQGWKEISTK